MAPVLTMETGPETMRLVPELRIKGKVIVILSIILSFSLWINLEQGETILRHEAESSRQDSINVAQGDSIIKALDY